MVSLLQANLIGLPGWLRCLVAFSRASLIVLFCGVNGKVKSSVERTAVSINTCVVDRAAIEPNRTESQVRSRKLELGS